MTPTQEVELREALHKAFAHAIKVVGFATFKATSLFSSNRANLKNEKSAA